MTNFNQSELHALICDLFSLRELRQICFDLGIDDEMFASRISDKPTLVREMILYFKQKELMKE